METQVQTLVALEERIRDALEDEDKILRRNSGKRKQLDLAIVKIKGRLTKRNGVSLHENLVKERDALAAELEDLQLQMEEYRAALNGLREQLVHLPGFPASCLEGSASSPHILEPSTPRLSENRADHEHEGSEVSRREPSLPTEVWEIEQQFERERRRVEAGLPIYARRKAVLDAVVNHQVVVLTAETGSGKSTQIAQYLVDHVRKGHLSGRIACTQPRKVAAHSLAHRVAKEFGCKVGEEIGMLGSRGSRTVVEYMSDKNLLSVFLHDKTLSEYGVVLVDEAHERSLHTDLLLGMLKRCLQERPALKVVVMSATIDTSTFLNFFGNSHPLHLRGRNYPIDIRYVDLHDLVLSGASVRQGELSYWRRAVQQALRIHDECPKGHILIFLTSQREVEDACAEASRWLSLGGKRVPAFVVPLHGKLPVEEQLRTFEDPPQGLRKIVFATNVAETSITLPGVSYVVDCGKVKECVFDGTRGVTSLHVVPIDKASATQRAGRAGRTGPGVCFRLYSREDFESFRPTKIAEICRQPLGMAVMQLLSLGLDDIKQFHFVEPPDPDSLNQALQQLKQLGAITLDSKLTDLGEKMARLGIEPPQAKLVLDSLNYGLGLEAIVISAMMKFGWSIFARGSTPDSQSLADAQRTGFAHHGGDLLTLLRIYREWEDSPRVWRNKWCQQCSIKAKLMRTAHDLVEEIRQVLRFELGINVPCWFRSSCEIEDVHADTLRKLIGRALVSRLALYSGNPRKGYIVVGKNQEAFLDSSSAVAIHGTTPRWVVYVDHMSTSSRNYLQMVTPVEREWLVELQDQMPWRVLTLEQSVLEECNFTGLGVALLERLVGFRESRLRLYEEEIKYSGAPRCIIEADSGRRELRVYVSMGHLTIAQRYMESAIWRMRQCLAQECIEESLCEDSTRRAIRIIVGEGATVRHLLMPRQYASLEITGIPGHVREETIFNMLKYCGEGLAGHPRWHEPTRRDHAARADTKLATPMKQLFPTKHSSPTKQCTVTFRSPESATVAVRQYDGFELSGSRLRLLPIAAVEELRRGRAGAAEQALQISISFPRRAPRDFAFVDCRDEMAMDYIMSRCQGIVLHGQVLKCQPSRTRQNSLFLCGISDMVTDDELLQILLPPTDRRDRYWAGAGGWDRSPILDFVRHRFDAEDGEEALTKRYEENLGNLVAETIPRDSFVVGMLEPRSLKAHYCNGWVRFHEDILQQQVKDVMANLQGKPLLRPWQYLSVKQRFWCAVRCFKDIVAVLSDELDATIEQVVNSGEGMAVVWFSQSPEGHRRYQITAESMPVFARAKKALDQVLEGTPVAGVSPNVMQLLFMHEGVKLTRKVEAEAHVRIVCSGRDRRALIYGGACQKKRALELLLQGLQKMHADGPESVRLKGPGLPVGFMRAIVKMYGADLKLLAEEAGAAQVLLQQRTHSLEVIGSPESKRCIRNIIATLSNMFTSDSAAKEKPHVVHTAPDDSTHGNEGGGELMCPICLDEIDFQGDGAYWLESCGHAFCRDCVVHQLQSTIESKSSGPGLPLRCHVVGCGAPLLIADLTVLLTPSERAQLWCVSLSTFVESSGGKVRFCRTPNCDAVYQTYDGWAPWAQGPGVTTCFTCPGCTARVCTECHVEYHDGLSCEEYRRYGEDPDASLRDWREGRRNVKSCPRCLVVIEKDEGCDHMTCKCGAHVCWVCLESFSKADDCYEHLRVQHGGIQNGGVFDMDY